MYIYGITKKNYDAVYDAVMMQLCIFHFSYDWLYVNESSSPYVDSFSGVCFHPCDFDAQPIPKSIISADGGQIKLNFTSDNYMHLPGFWVEYEIGIKYFNGSYFCYLLNKKHIHTFYFYEW